MSKKTIKILISILSVIIISLFAVAFIVSRDSGDLDGVPSISDTFLGSFFPDDNDSKGSSGIAGGSENKESLFEDGRGEVEKRPLSLRQISFVPTSGGVIFERNKENIVRYMEKATGHIYEVDINQANPKRIANTTIPRVRETIWSKDGKYFIARFLDEETEVIKSFSGSVSEGSGEIEGVFLVDDINQIVISEDSKKIFYMKSSFNDGAIGIISNFEGGNKIEIFKSKFSEWLLSWPRESSIILTTKPSSRVLGYSYILSTTKGRFDKIFGSIDGLTTLSSPNATKILYSKSLSRGNISLNLYNTSNDKTSEFDISTLPEKCVWTSDSIIVYCGVPTFLPNVDYPDEWYQGQVSFSDDIWRIDIENNFVDLLVITKELIGIDLDITNLMISPDENYIIFLNKKDATLWSFYVGLSS